MSFLSRLMFRRTKQTQELFHNYFFELPKASETVVAATSGGRVVGFRTALAPSAAATTNDDVDVFSFRGIPFATAARNAAPSPVQPWSGEKDCRMFGPACPQPPYGLNRIFYEGFGPAIVEAFFPPLPPHQSYSFGTFSETDCLNANVCTTSIDPDAKKKVLVWIHGGGCRGGSNVEGGFYDGTQLAAETDSCVIGINYRHNMFGFLHFPEEGITNLGIRDQIAALHWVQENCANFGGDPDRITILGESSGGTSVATLLGSAEARGLFHRAVCMSQFPKQIYSPRLYERTFDVIEKAFSKELQGQPLTAKTFAALPVETIQARMGNLGLFSPTLKTLGTWKLMFGPYNDGDAVHRLGPHQGLIDCQNSILDREDGGVQVMAGCMRDEWKLFTEIFSMLPKPKNRSAIPEAVTPALRCYFETVLPDDTPDSERKWAAIANELYDQVEASRASRGLPTDVTSVFVGIMTLLLYHEPTYCLARDSKPGAYAYTIELEDEPLGSAHARDVALLFKGGHPSLHPVQDERFVGNLKDMSHPVHEVGNSFIQAVASFAETGRPSIHGPDEWETFPSSMDIKAGGCTTRPMELPEIAFMQELKQQVAEDFEEVDRELLVF